MNKSRKIELLAPAKNLECGIEAINHGADAVYIGAPQFSARSAAGCSLADIEVLVLHAHQFGARVYVAMNTIIKDSELDDIEKLIWKLYDIKVDAIIVQDMGILMLNLPPIPLHASTQTDNRTAAKVKFLQDVGFSQVVLARELTLEEIQSISSQTDVVLEAFVHGALCVCYSGQCYLSEALSQRSANRGSCAQYCRLPYTLIDSEGEVVMKKKHLLSMKDLNLSDHLEEMIDAGVSSFKIEGRLKDVSYVKNTVAYYRQKLDNILTKRTEYIRASSGKSTFSFKPNLEKSFNRGFTEYFLNGRISDIWSINSPKSIGEPIGKIKEVFDRFFVVSGTTKLNNGDGLCFLNEKGELQGIRVNRIDGERIYPYENNVILRKNTQIYRNHDQEFEKELNKKSAERKISIQILIKDAVNGFTLCAEDEDSFTTQLTFNYGQELAQKEQSDNIIKNLSKTGGTIFKVDKVDILFSQNWFIPSSVLSDWRRQLIENLQSKRIKGHYIEIFEHKQTQNPYPSKQITYLGNIMNQKSQQFYTQHQSQVKEFAFEKQHQKNVPLMFTRHCVKQSMGWCSKEKQTNHPYREPFYLIYNDTKLLLNFDCKQCEMKVLKCE